MNRDMMKFVEVGKTYAINLKDGMYYIATIVEIDDDNLLFIDKRKKQVVTGIDAIRTISEI